MKKIAAWFIISLAMLPAFYIMSRLGAGKTIIIVNDPPSHPLIIGSITMALFVLLAVTLRNTIVEYWQLGPILFLTMGGYAFFFSEYLYHDIMEYRLFSKPGEFYTKDMTVIGKMIEPSRSGPNYKAVLKIAGRGDFRPKVPVTFALYQLIGSADRQENGGFEKENNSCSLKVQVEKTQYAERIFYRRAFDVGDIARC